MELRDLPRVDTLADRLTANGLTRLVATTVARQVIADARTAIQAGGDADPESDAARIAHQLHGTRPTRMVNATGVLLHTNLGRAPMARRAAEDAQDLLTDYGNVEFDIRTGRRGRRAGYARYLLTVVTGAEAAIIFNNNAAALLVALAAIAGDGNAVVSRGEEIEIGGSFRLPELMAASGANLVEVGTTNRTRLTDYERVANEASAFLKVHPSNYRLEGFAESVSYADLAALANRTGVPLIADVGSGLLDANVPWVPGSPPTWLAAEPGVRQTLQDGADVVLFSGDKLLGGPQAGIAVGRSDLITLMAQHPLARAVRIDGATHAALAATLELYADDRGGEIPFWAMASLDYDSLERRHNHLLEALGGRGEVIVGESLPGAGSVPGETIPSPNLRLAGKADELWERLLSATPPVLARRREGELILDLRTVDPADDSLLARILS
ncbi:MAG: L-seryl-tRNA(Sec) selenium transferase [Acidimicrobiia bacterium]|nr:L-seryl-tRNA(Sec) selenium transferase [Acidimicrobiia bacterium]